MKTNSFGCLVTLALLLTAPVAAGKGITFSIRTSPDTPKVGEVVQITVHGVSEIPGERTPACAGMRVLAVSPSVSVKEALRVIEGGQVSRSVRHWGAFRLASLRRVDNTTWVARLRPNMEGSWTLVIPNWCAAGYVLPDGVLTQQIVVGRDLVSDNPRRETPLRRHPIPLAHQQ